MTRWLLTREGDDLALERDVLRSRGAEIVAVPCIETEWHAWPWADSTARALMVFTSRRAVHAWHSSGTEAPRQLAALRPATTKALEEAGLEATLTAEGGVVALAREIVWRWPLLNPTPAWIRYPTSRAGTTSPEQNEALALLEPLAPIDRAVVYDVTRPRELCAAIREHTRSPWSVIFASPSAVTHFFATRIDSPAPRHAVCFGTSTARAWNEARPSHWPTAVATSDLRSTLLEVT
ncbi:MAG: uroporphyrinogen-III synthase [Archangium sp.]